MRLVTVDAVTQYCRAHLRPVRTVKGRWVVPSAQIDAVHRHFGTTVVDYINPDPVIGGRAQLVGDTMHAVQASLLEACLLADERNHR